MRMDRDWLARLKAPSLSQDSRLPRWSLFTALAGLLGYGVWRRLQPSGSQKRLKTAEADDPTLLRKHSTYQTYTTASGHRYQKIRTFFKEHQQSAELPKDIPLLVFMHGLGGSTSQFNTLLTTLINTAPCLAIDLPGCGLSEFSPNNDAAYTTHAFAELLAAAISRYRYAGNDQKVVLIGHSMGCSINTLLASSTSPISHLLEEVVIGMVAICPRATPLTENEIKSVQLMTSVPIPVFDILRFWDRRGGLSSRSVSRVVGRGADEETRRRQLKYNEQSESGPFLRILRASTGSQGLPGKDIWSGIKIPLFLVTGDSDSITSPREVELITSWLTSAQHLGNSNASIGHATPSELPTTTGDTATKLHKASTMPPRTESGNVIKDDQTSTKHNFALKTTIFPEPAAHGLMYASSTARVLIGMIDNFLSHHIDERLDPGWQMHTLTTSGKWDVKNLKKWQGTAACSEPIGGLFRAMKTMRQVDDEHSPKEFVKKWGWKVLDDGVVAVVDISHETPVYHPVGLEEAGVEYHKFPTVSKEKPTAEEAESFITLIDELRQKSAFSNSTAKPTIGVHCHYGFNRTGFLIVCFLVERENYKLEDAIEEFKQKRPPGIKHDHFVSELFVRYAIKLQRRATVLEE